MAEQDAPPGATAPTQENGAPPVLGAEIPETPSAEELGDFVSPEEAEATAHDGLPPGTDKATNREANDALASMLSAEPPPLPTEIFHMKPLAERMGIEEFDVQLRGLNDSELAEISDRAVKPPTKQQKKMGMTKGSPDFTKMKRLVVAQAMMSPDLRNPALLDKYGPRPEDVISRWFLSGEIDQLNEAVNDMSGFGTGAVERAKE